MSNALHENLLYPQLDTVYTHLDIIRQPPKSEEGKEGDAINDRGASCRRAMSPKPKVPRHPKVQLEFGRVYLEQGFNENLHFVCTTLPDKYNECWVMFFDGTPCPMYFESAYYVLLANSVSDSLLYGIPYT